MVRIFCLIALLFYYPAQAQVIKHQSTTAGAYYYSAGSDAYPNDALTVELGDDLGSSVTVPATTITNIGFKLVSKGVADVKIMLVNPAGAVHECQTIANSSLTDAGWNDVTLSTPLTITSGQAVKVWVTSSGDAQTVLYFAAGTAGLLYRATVYADFCSATDPGADTGVGPVGVRVYAH